jgi:hypothetical protein
VRKYRLLIIAAVTILAGSGAWGQSDSFSPIRFLEGKLEGSGCRTWKRCQHTRVPV